MPHSLPTATAGVNVRTLCAVRASAASPRPHSPLRRHTPYTYTPVRRTSTPLPTYPTDARCRLRCPSPGCSPPTTHNASSLCDRCTCAPHWRCSDRTNTPGCHRRQRPADDPVTRHPPRTRPSSIITGPAPTHPTGGIARTCTLKPLYSKGTGPPRTLLVCGVVSLATGALSVPFPAPPNRVASTQPVTRAFPHLRLNRTQGAPEQAFAVGATTPPHQAASARVQLHSQPHSHIDTHARNPSQANHRVEAAQNRKHPRPQVVHNEAIAGAHGTVHGRWQPLDDPVLRGTIPRVQLVIRAARHERAAEEGPCKQRSGPQFAIRRHGWRRWGRGGTVSPRAAQRRGLTRPRGLRRTTHTHSSCLH